MSQTLQTTHSATSTRAPAMPAWAAEIDLDDARRYAYTEGWDDEDAELGWVDADVVSRKRRLH